MKMLIAAAALATLVASPAFAQSYDPDLGTGTIVQWNSSTAFPQPSGREGFARVAPRAPASAYTAYGAVTPFGSPVDTGNGTSRMNAGREAALRACSLESRRYTQTTWGNMDAHQHRTCIAQHGQME
jgi:hypothetical protein